MRKKELTPAQKEYRQFDRRRGIIVKVLIALLVVILICLGYAFRLADLNATPLFVVLGVLCVYTVITSAVCCRLANKHCQLYAAAYGNDSAIIRTGLFGELWKEFEWNQYEGITDGKVVCVETHNNTIGLEILRKKHEFLIEINCESLHMICDEETDTPIEREIPLSDFQDVVSVFVTIREFVETNS